MDEIAARQLVQEIQMIRLALEELVRLLKAQAEQTEGDE